MLTWIAFYFNRDPTKAVYSSKNPGKILEKSNILEIQNSQKSQDLTKVTIYSINRVFDVEGNGNFSNVFLDFLLPTCQKEHVN